MGADVTGEGFACYLRDSCYLGTCGGGLIRAANGGWLFTLAATVLARERELVFADSEEMCFGARMATPLTEKNGGQILVNDGTRGSKDTFGREWSWTDYSGVISGQRLGVAIFAHPGNPRPSRWQNRDYGFFGANVFGPSAYTGGAPQPTRLKAGGELRLRFAAWLHAGDAKNEPNVAAAFADYTKSQSADSAKP